MMNRSEFDSFLKLYGIPTNDDKYNQYKKSQTSSLVNKQYNELAGQIKRKLVKPTYPDIIVGPGTAPGNKANMDKYHKNLDAYNKQQELLKKNKDIISKLQNKPSNSVSKPSGSFNFRTNVNQQTQNMLNKVKQSLNNPTKDEEYEKQQYQKFQQQQKDKASGKISKSTPNITAPTITPHGIIKPPEIIKPNKIPNTHRHINHNIMSLNEYRNIMLTQGMGVGQAQYKDYLRKFHLNNPTDYLKGQLEINAKQRAGASLAKGHSIEQHQAEHAKNIVNHITNNKVSLPGTINNAPVPAAIKLHNFSTPTPAHNEHHVDAHSLHKESTKQAYVGNPVNAEGPKVVSGVREDAHPALVNKPKIITPMSATPAVLSREQQEQAQYAKFQAQQAAGGGGQQIRSLPNP